MQLKAQTQIRRKMSLQEQINIHKSIQQNTKNQNETQQQLKCEFIIRQREYDELYKFPNYESEKLLNISQKQEQSQSKFRTIINDAKLKFINSHQQLNQQQNEKQQNSIKIIVEQLRNQKKPRYQTIQNQIQNNNQINLNLALAVIIPILCLFVVLIEYFKKNMMTI